MILVFGGTTEGKQAIEVLTTLQYPFVYSTKTKVSVPEKTNYRFGALNAEEMKAFMRTREIQLVVNCAHPFASELHQTIQTTASDLRINVIRLERTFPKRTVHPLVRYVSIYQEALVVLANYQNQPLLALSGVQSVPKLKGHWQTTLTYFRILDKPESKSIAKNNGFPADQLILGLSEGTLATEVETIRRYKIGVMLIKESGESGGLSTKIKAALACKVPVIIIKKPVLPTGFLLVNNPAELTQAIQTCLS